MTYFHPFTLDPARETEHVPYLGDLTRGHQTWEDAMTSWFDGRVLCEEARRYISNFLVVTRARPESGIEDEVRSDDQASDEELYLDRASFEEAIGTKVGTGTGRQAQEKTAAAIHAEEPAGQSFSLAKVRWAPPELKDVHDCLEGVPMDPEVLQEARAAARAS